jgi:hypothetical protein
MCLVGEAMAFLARIIIAVFVVPAMTTTVALNWQQVLLGGQRDFQSSRGGGTPLYIKSLIGPEQLSYVRCGALYDEGRF